MNVIESTMFYILFGTPLLIMGKRLFWLFVGILGFIYGFVMASFLFTGLPEAIVILSGIVFGAISIILSIFLERFAIILAGILVGGTIIRNFAITL